MAMQLVEEHAPDVILLDLHLPRQDGPREQDAVEVGLDLLKSLSCDFPASAVLVLTVDEEPDTLFDVMRFGANGYLFKNTDFDGDTLIDKVLRIASGDRA
jgi:DNA-binding NarL/FixJ family response regulator